MKASLIERAKLRGIVHWLLAIAVLLYIVSGFGITQYRAVEAVTFGVLTKELSFRLHGILFLPFIVLLAFHIYFTVLGRKRGKKGK